MRAPVSTSSDLTPEQFSRLVESVARQLVSDEEYRHQAAIFLAKGFTLADYENWFWETAG